MKYLLIIMISLSANTLIAAPISYDSISPSSKICTFELIIGESGYGSTFMVCDNKSERQIKVDQFYTHTNAVAVKAVNKMQSEMYKRKFKQMGQCMSLVQFVEDDDNNQVVVPHIVCSFIRN